jgi:hypothetical protein
MIRRSLELTSLVPWQIGEMYLLRHSNTSLSRMMTEANHSILDAGAAWL